MVQLLTPNRGMGPPWGAFCQITLTSCCCCCRKHSEIQTTNLFAKSWVKSYAVAADDKIPPTAMRAALTILLLSSNRTYIAAFTSASDISFIAACLKLPTNSFCAGLHTTRNKVHVESNTKTCSARHSMHI